MNATAAATAGALTFIWVGMVVAISFLEAPLKFRAPGVTVPIGLGIGRVVFRALNIAEIVLAIGIIVAVAAGRPPTSVVAFCAAAAVILAAQLVAVRPRLNRRSDRILAGADLPRSRMHLYYVGFEVAKVGCLIGLGASILAA